MNQLELEDKILIAQKTYYDGNPTMEDDEFDLLWETLQINFPNSILLKSIGSDTSLFPKAKHLMMMGSQQKAANEDQFKKWFNKQNTKSFLVQYKIDGLSLELQYINGKLVDAVTRGDGITGDSVINNVRKIKSIPQNLKESFTGAVRGEILLYSSIRKQYFPDLANNRNGAVGILKNKIGEGCEFLNFIAYDVWGLEDTIDEEGKLEFLNRNEFTVVFYHKMRNCSDIIKVRNETNNNRKDLDYDIDGLVIKCIEFDPSDLKRDRPEKQIAFKFDLESAITELIWVDWRQNGKTITPVARVKPCSLNGTTVQNASLHNMDILDKLIAKGMQIGSMVKIVKRGEIIPYVEEIMS